MIVGQTSLIGVFMRFSGQLDKLMNYPVPLGLTLQCGLSYPVITEERNVAIAVRRVSTLVRELADFNWPRDWKIPAVKSRRPSKMQSLIECLERAIRLDLKNVRECYPIHRLNPYVEALENSLLQKPHQQLTSSGRKGNLYGLTVNGRSELRALIIELVDFCGSKKFEDALDARRKHVGENVKSANEYVSRVLTASQGTMAFLIDLAYEPPLEHRVAHCAQKWKRAHKSFQKIIRFARQNLSMKGYVAKLEFSSIRGYVFRTIMIVAASSRTHVDEISQALSKHWSSKIAPEKGVALAHGFRFPSGVVDCEENSADLIKFIQQMIAEDFWIKFSGPKKTFTHGL